ASGGLTASELLVADDHLIGCESCSRLLSEFVGADQRIAVFARDIQEDLGEHLSYEQLESFVDRTAAEVDRETMAAHMKSCADCRMHAEELDRVREEFFSSSAGNRFAPASAQGRGAKVLFLQRSIAFQIARIAAVAAFFAIALVWFAHRNALENRT